MHTDPTPEHTDELTVPGTPELAVLPLSALFSPASADRRAAFDLAEGEALEVFVHDGERLLQAIHTAPEQRVVTAAPPSARWKVLGLDLGAAPTFASGLALFGWIEAETAQAADITLPEESARLFVRDGDTWRTEDGAQEIGAAPVEFTMDGLTIRARTVAAPRPVPRAGAEWGFLSGLGTLTGIAALFAAFVIAEPGRTTTSLIETEAAISRLNLEVRTPPPVPVVASRSKETAPAAKGVRAPRKDPRPPAAGGGSGGSPVTTAGILGILGDGPIGSGDGIGDLVAGIGKHGPGGRGPGKGPGFGGRGPGGFGAIDGDGTELGPRGIPDGAPDGGLGERREGVIAGPSGDPVVIGSIDRSLVDEVVKRHLPAIRYCYERQLQRDPDLSGRVVVRFAIAADGSVSSSSIHSSTMDNADVESCIARRFSTMTFPQLSKGVVVVRYPFEFSGGA